MAARGLPGFLRRSLRPVEYEEEEEDEEEEKEGVTNNGVAKAPIEALPDVSSVSESMDRGTGAVPAQRNGSSSIQLGDPHTDLIDDSNTSNSLADSWRGAIDADTTGTMSYRESQFAKSLGADVVNMGELRQLAWNGVPYRYRPQVWKILLGYLPTNASRREQTLRRKRSEYREAMAQHYDVHDDSRTVQEQETLRQVLVDVPRTQPDIPLFRNDRIKRVLSRILYIWAMRHPASSYVQGINDLATPLISVFLADYFEGSPPSVVLDGHVMNHLSDEKLDEIEADVYWCITNLLAGIQDHYTADQPGVQRMVRRLEELVHRIDSELTVHLRDNIGIQFLQFSFKWMNCLLLREFHLQCIFRLWDTYLSEKGGFEDFHVYVCAALMCQFSSELREMSFDELFGFMQEIPTTDWTDSEIEVLLSQAFVLSTLFKGSDAHLAASSSSLHP